MKKITAAVLTAIFGLSAVATFAEPVVSTTKTITKATTTAPVKVAPAPAKVVTTKPVTRTAKKPVHGYETVFAIISV